MTDAVLQDVLTSLGEPDKTHKNSKKSLTGFGGSNRRQNLPTGQDRLPKRISSNRRAEAEEKESNSSSGSSAVARREQQHGQNYHRDLTTSTGSEIPRLLQPEQSSSSPSSRGRERADFERRRNLRRRKNQRRRRRQRNRIKPPSSTPEVAVVAFGLTS